VVASSESIVVEYATEVDWKMEGEVGGGLHQAETGVSLEGEDPDRAKRCSNCKSEIAL
jgi:hypothetical protein